MCTPQVCQVAKSKVDPDPMFGSRNNVGYGLIALRDIKEGEKFYTLLETDIDVEIVPRRQAIDNFDVFHYGKKDVLQPLGWPDQSYECRVLQQPAKKPLLYFVQHDAKGNVQVIYTNNYTSCTPHLHRTLTLCTQIDMFTHEFETPEDTTVFVCVITVVSPIKKGRDMTYPYLKNKKRKNTNSEDDEDKRKKPKKKRKEEVRSLYHMYTLCTPYLHQIKEKEKKEKKQKEEKRKKPKKKRKDEVRSL